MKDRTYVATSNPMVNQPSHYQSHGLEAIDIIEAVTDGMNGIEACDTGNALKYLIRWKKKNGIEDLQKALWYISHLIKKLEEKNAIKEIIPGGTPGVE